MSEGHDPESKTEPGSEKKIREALEKGNVPVSREAGVACALLALLVVSNLILPEKGMILAGKLGQMLDGSSGWSLRNSEDATLLLGAVLRDCSLILLPILLIFTVFGLLASFAQNAPAFIADRIAFKASRISPMEGWNRLFGAQGRIEFLKILFKFIAISLVVYLVLQSERAKVLESIFVPASELPRQIHLSLDRLVTSMCLAAGLIAAIDFLTVRLKWHRDLRMTKQELKDEFKESEGDPVVKGRLRSLALDRSRRRMIAAVPNATLIIANPTHYAIALRYVRSENAAPLVVAKGQDLIALKIREVAEQHGIPVIEDKALARSMYDQVEVDRLIPAAFYRAVAELVHYLASKKNRKSQASIPQVSSPQVSRKPFQIG